jgi:hypothetical protein
MGRKAGPVKKNPCTGHNRKGGPCENAAIKGSDKCRHHGGKTPIKHGLRSKYVKEDVLKTLEETYGESTTTTAKANTELLNAMLLTRLKDTELGDLLPVFNESRRWVELLHKIEHGEQVTITEKGVEEVLRQIINVANSTIKDKSSRDRLIS